VAATGKRSTSIVATVLAPVGLGFVVAAGVAVALGESVPHALPIALLAVGGMTALAVGVTVRGTVVRRLKKMVRTLARVSSSNFAVRCEAGEDDIGRLGQEINGLLKKLTDLNVNVIDADRELQWTQKELKLKEELAEKGKLLAATNTQLESRVKELGLLFATSRALSSTLEMDNLISNFCQSGAKVLEVDRLAIFVHDESQSRLIVTGTSGFKEAAGRVQGMRFASGEGASGTVFQKKTMLYVKDLEKDHRFLHFRGKLRMEGSALLLPLLSGDKCIGVLLLNRERREGFSFEDVGLFHIIANQIAGAVANALLYHKTEELATRDGLTGLHNRRALEERLEMEWERSARFSTVLSCIMIDVDHFKKFNDEYGHLVGDEVLRQFAGLATRLLRRVDTVARYGGEEFCILLPRTERDEARLVAEKLRQQATALAVPTGADMPSVAITISAGLATSKDHPATARQLLEMADHALLNAKGAGRNCVRSY
jgi:diguanylate cyclase (GGDEF)-like protein